MPTCVLVLLVFFVQVRSIHTVFVKIAPVFTHTVTHSFAGKTNDCKAYAGSRISELVESLPEGFFVIGDNAYINTDHMLVPYPGRNEWKSKEDTFNFFASQLRVRIENAFALLVRRWGILQKPLQMALKNQPVIIKAICCLHNFCIDEKEPSIVPTGPITRVTADGCLQDPCLRTRFVLPFSNTVRSDVCNKLANYMTSANVWRPFTGVFH